MKKTWRLWSVIFTVIVLAFLVKGCGDDETPSADPPLRAAYPGADDCKGCHATQFQNWQQSGHAYKFSAVNGSVPIYPFTDVSAMFPVTINHTGYDSTEMTVSNTSYLIGGYKWKVRWVDSNGKIKHGTNAQYNLETGEFVAYNDSTADEYYACGECHTTGWAEPSRAGAMGTFTYLGVTCQRCHGSDTAGGAGHNTKNAPAGSLVPAGMADTAYSGLATHTASNNVCSDCHIRGTDKATVKVSGKLIQHHEQSHELFVGRHGAAGTEGGSLTCTTCHDPHSSVVWDSQAVGEGVYSSKISNGNCTVSCHSGKTVSSSFGTEHTCVDCHMPYLVKSARSVSTGAKTVSGVTALGIPTTGNVRGDIRAHIFALSATEDATFLSANVNGSSGQKKVPVDFSCMTCHGAGGTKGPTTASAAAALAPNVHQ